MIKDIVQVDEDGRTLSERTVTVLDLETHNHIQICYSTFVESNFIIYHQLVFIHFLKVLYYNI